VKFQEKLQLLRKEKGFSQEQLAEKIGISRQAIAKWEVGQSYPDLDNLITLSDLFKISIDKLVRNHEDDICSHDGSKQKFDFEQHVLEFLCKAKKLTYAGKGAETDSCRPNSHDFQYEENNLKYIDTYLGGEKFAGEEALWRDDIPFWAMNYIGRVIAEEFSGEFLKEALRLVQKEYPYRGPMVYQNGDYKYHCIVTGAFEWFQGYEEIYCNDSKVYECFFHGGTL